MKKTKFAAILIGVLLVLSVSLACGGKNCTVTFKNGNTIVAEINSGKLEGNIPADPEKEGYEFDGWFTEGGVEFEIGMRIKSNLVFSAKFTKLHIVTFHSSGGSAVNPVAVRDGEKISAPQAAYPGGIALLYWADAEGNEFNFAETPITADITLTAVWDLPSKNTSGVNYDLSGEALFAIDMAEDDDSDSVTSALISQGAANYEITPVINDGKITLERAIPLQPPP